MKQFILVFSLILICTVASATHLMGGFITYTRDTGPNPNPRKIFYTLTLITDRNSPADEPVARINMGDDIFVDVRRTSVTQINPYYSRMEFNWDYTYGADGTYSASWNGINRNPSLLNVAQPSDQTSMFITTTVNISASRGFNSSPQFLAPEFIPARVGQTLKFNLLAYDPDGDSLVYTLRTPLQRVTQGEIQPVPEYTLPGNAFSCQNSTNTGNAAFNLNSRTGQLTWDAPCRKGEYALAIAIEQWKGNLKLGEVVYDMTIKVDDNTGSGIVLENTDKLKFTAAGYIEAKINQELELKINYSQLSQAKSPIPAKFDNPTVEEYFASELTQIFNVPVTYTLENTATGVVGTFRFTPTKELARNRPYFVSFHGIKETYLTTASFGIVIRDNEPELRLIETQELAYSAAKYILLAPEELTTIKVLAEDHPNHVVTLTAESLLAEGTSKFTFNSQQTPEGTMGQLSIQPNKSQISSFPQTITFKAVYNPTSTTEGGTPLTKELQVQVIVVPKSLIPYLSKNKPKSHFIFPNRVLDKFTVQTEAPALLSIYTLQGKIILKKQLQPGDTEILKPNTIPGLYFYTLTTPDGKKTTGKLILQ